MEILAQLDPDFQLDATAQLFKALAEPARLRILNLLAHGEELCNCQVEAVTGYRNPKIYRHFQFLKHAGLIQFRREGTWISIHSVNVKVIDTKLYRPSCYLCLLSGILSVLRIWSAGGLLPNSP